MFDGDQSPELPHPVPVLTLTPGSGRVDEQAGHQVQSNRSRYCVTIQEEAGSSSHHFDDADQTMKAVNRFLALRITDLVISDATGAVLSERQLAMIIMEERLVVTRTLGVRR